MMEIDGWTVKCDEEGNFLRTSRERPKTHYLITLLKNFALDIELLKTEVDSLPEEEKQKTLLDTMRKSISEIGDKMPWESTIQWK